MYKRQDEACTMPLAEIDMIDFTTLEDGTLQLYAGYKEVTPEEPETPEEKPTEPAETPSAVSYTHLAQFLDVGSGFLDRSLSF